MSTHTILVAFSVQANDEASAAKVLTDILVESRLTQTHRAEDGYAEMAALGPIECWWTPNNPEADGNDMDYYAMFVPHCVPAEVIDRAIADYEEGHSDNTTF